MIAFWSYIEISNRNSINMTTRQKFLKAVYPIWMWFAGKKDLNTKNLVNQKSNPALSFYTSKDTAIDGTAFDFEKLKGKKIMLVNTASDCGYTGQSVYEPNWKTKPLVTNLKLPLASALFKIPLGITSAASSDVASTGIALSTIVL